MSVPSPEPDRPTLISGPGSFDTLPGICDELEVRRVLVVAGRACQPLASRALRHLGRRGMGTFADPRPHVPAHEVNLAVASAQEVHADAVLSIGGGSTTGFGKIIALALRLPLIAVPTSYTGAEMTSRYLVTTDRGKESGTSPRVLPRIAIHDPALTATLPAALTASSGMTAVASCLGALARTDLAPTAAADAHAGLELLWHTLPRLLAGPADLARRADALRGAALAGRTLERTGPGLTQLIAEELGAVLGADHGAVLGCVTARMLAGAGPEATPARAALRALTGRGEPAEVLLAEFGRGLGLPDRLADICAVPEPESWARRAAARPHISAPASAFARLLDAP